MNSIYRINLGCGLEKLDGFINIDISKKVNPDYVLDIKKGFPKTEPWGKDNSVFEVRCFCMLEQLDTKYEFRDLLNEIWRVIEKNGIFRFSMPSANFPCAFNDPWDTLKLNENWLKYVDIKEHAYEEFGKHYGFKAWKEISYSINPSGIIWGEMCPNK